MATQAGYLVQCEPYAGAKTGNTMPHLGVGGSVVCDLISELPQTENLHLYMDNFFTSLSLLDHLSAKGIGCTGTVRTNRLQNAPIKSLTEVKKTQRGYSYSLKNEDSSIRICGWNDSNVVHLASNCHGRHPLGSAKRWCRTTKRTVEITQPYIVKMYNMYMGGVDQLDQNIACYRISIRKRRWWWPLVAWSLNVIMNNAWQLWRIHVDKKTTHLDFMRAVTLPYLSVARAERKNRSTISSLGSGRKRVRIQTRCDGEGHFLQRIPKQRKCAFCHKKVMKLCDKCNVPLHLDCFPLFHAKMWLFSTISFFIPLCAHRPKKRTLLKITLSEIFMWSFSF